MIVVRIELWPGGLKKFSRHLGTAVIANDGSGDRDEGNYDVILGKFGEEDPFRILKVQSAVWKSGRVEGFRRRQRGPWDLLAMSLVSLVGKRIGKET